MSEVSVMFRGCLIGDVWAVITSLCDWSGDCGEGVWITDRGHRQEEVPGPLRHHSGSVHVDHQETHPAAVREGHLPVCGHDGASVQVRGSVMTQVHNNRYRASERLLRGLQEIIFKRQNKIMTFN